MKILTPEEEQAHYNATLKGGVLGGVLGTAAGTLGVYAASARYPAFRSLTLPFRVFLAASTGTFASIVVADRYSRGFEAERRGGERYKDEAASLQEQINAQKTGKQRTMDWLQENRYSIVFGSWVVSMAAALGIVGRARWLTTQQKLVQARVYAQGFTIAAVIVSLAFEGGDRMAKSGRWETVKIIDPNDPTHKHLIEKRIHHERYAGEDQWMDMVEAEERRLKEREAAAKKQSGEDGGKSEGNGKDKKGSSGKHVPNLEKGKPTEAKDSKLSAP